MTCVTITAIFKTSNGSSMHHAEFLTTILILLAAAVAVVALFRQLRLSPVLGYLAAGAFIGPHGPLPLLEDVAGTSAIAEVGVIFLLFIIGLELSYQRLRAMRKHVFGLGSAQVLVTGFVIAAVVWLMGFSPEIAVIVGGGLALSSTALVLQVVAENREKSSQVGRLSLAVLLLQDLAVVPLLVLVPLLASSEANIWWALGNAGLRAAIALVVVFLVGKWLLRPLFKMIADLQNSEIFSAFTLLVVLGISWLFQQAGLSMALGAFVAGLLVAETEFRHQVEADIMPYKGLFLGLFFMVVGMTLDVGLIAEHFFSIFGVVFALMFGKALIILMLCRFFGFTRGAALHSGLVLAQGGEFAFILFGLAAAEGIMGQELSQMLMVIITVSMALTPLAYLLGKVLAKKMESSAANAALECEQETIDMDEHVVIIGYGRVGQTVGKMLAEENINYVALDMDSAIVTKAREKGLPAYFGDGARREVLNAVSVTRARAVVIAVNDFTTANKAVKTLRGISTLLPIVARTSDIAQMRLLERAGADLVVSEKLEAGLHLGGALLRNLGFVDVEVSRVLDIFRASDYALAREGEVKAGKKQDKSMGFPIVFRKAAIFGFRRGAVAEKT